MGRIFRTVRRYVTRRVPRRRRANAWASVYCRVADVDASDGDDRNGRVADGTGTRTAGTASSAAAAERRRSADRST